MTEDEISKKKKEYQKEYRLKNKENQKEYQKAYREKNRKGKKCRKIMSEYDREKKRREILEKRIEKKIKKYGTANDLKGEEWRKIPGYENEKVEISNLGRLKSYKAGSPRILKTIKLNSPNYKPCYVCISNGPMRKFQISQLVAMAFLDFKTDGHNFVVDHIDNNPQNNKLENLQIITHRENCSKDKWRKGKTSDFTGVDYISSKNYYKSTIRLSKDHIFLGGFNIEEEAARIYEIAIDLSRHYNSRKDLFRILCQNKLRQEIGIISLRTK